MKKLLIPAALAVLASLGVTACGSSSSSSSSASSSTSSTSSAASGSSTSVTVYIDEIPGKSATGADDPAKDKFWFGATSTDTTPVTTYSVSLAKGGTLKVVNTGDDPEKLTVTGPGGFSQTPTIAAGPNTSQSVTLTDAGSYSFSTEPTTSPTRPGAEGGTVTVS